MLSAHGTVRSLFAMFGFFVVTAWTVHARCHARPLAETRALPAVVHVAPPARPHRTASMPRTTDSWTLARNSYRSVSR